MRRERLSAIVAICFVVGFALTGIVGETTVAAQTVQERFSVPQVSMCIRDRANRAWLRGEMPDGELAAAHAAALAAGRDSEGIGRSAAWSCVWASETHCPGGNARDAANDAAWVAAEESARAAAAGIPGMAPWSAAWTCAWEMGFYTERRWQVEALKGLLQEAQP